MNLYDILGPVMVGPSSSHTAGAARIGLVSRKLLGEAPAEAVIGLSGSFAATGKGHGTDKALVAGLLGMQPDDDRIPASYEIAEQEGFSFWIEDVPLKDAHPNTALLQVKGRNGRELKVQASSLGGGRIRVDKLDGIDVNFSGDVPTLVVRNEDQPGLVAEVTSLLCAMAVNIATMQLYRDRRGGCAVMVLETDQAIPEIAIQALRHVKGVLKVTYLNIAE